MHDGSHKQCHLLPSPSASITYVAAVQPQSGVDSALTAMVWFTVRLDIKVSSQFAILLD